MQSKSTTFFQKVVFHASNKRGLSEHETIFPDGRKIVIDASYGDEYPNSYMDIYLPLSGDKRPVLFYIHGGGYCWGDKSEYEPLNINKGNGEFFKMLNDCGIAVFSLNYALCDEYTYPVPLKQLADAIRFVCGNAEKYGIDTSKIAFGGDSAGGQLSGQLALLITDPVYAKQAGIEAPLTAEQLKAVVFYSTPYDMTDMGMFEKVGQEYFGTGNLKDNPKAREASIINNITAAFPPCLVSDGNKGTFPHQALKMDELLNSMSVEHELYLTDPKEAKLMHGYEVTDEKYGKYTRRKAVSFLKKHLQPQVETDDAEQLLNTGMITWDQSGYDYKGPLMPAAYLRHDFSTVAGLRKATLFMTSLGNYVPYLNGKKVDDQLLTPGYTEYSERLQYQEYDVTGLIKEGENAIGAVVGDGWYRGSCGPMGMRASYGEELALSAVLKLSYEDRDECIISDEYWRYSVDGPIREQDLKLKEYYDASKEMTGWNEAGFDDTRWSTCLKAVAGRKLIPSEGEKITAHEVFIPQVLKTPDGSVVLDFGQNMAGYVSFTVTGTKGTAVRLLHGEVLDEKGNFTTSNIGDERILKLGQEIIYVLKDGTQTYEPLFLICGFRYVKLIDWPEEVKAENFRAHAVYSDIKMTASFECSNEKINRLVENTVWSLKSNFVDIPTDCPQRERSGWTGDINVFIECADLLCDSRKFIRKWLKDVLLTQMDDGAVLSIVPKVYMMNRKNNETTPGAAGWADAITQIPMRQYMVYGDKTDLELCYEGMKKFVDYNVKRASSVKIIDRVTGKKDSGYILDKGFHYGEWLEPGSANMANAIKAYTSPDAEVATAWFYYSSRTLAETAEILGYEKDQEYYHELSEKIKSAYQSRFVKEGKINSNRQCKYVRPLYMGLLDEKEAKTAAEDLFHMVRDNRYKIGTGFLSTYQILNVLTDYGYNEAAYRMLENEECPGWLYEVNQGATTIWEGWDAIDPKTGKVKAKSLNHYSPGAAVSWLWTRCAGIQALEPGYAKILIKPQPGGKMTYAKASFDSVRGRISSSWKIEDGKFIVDIETPSETTLCMPDGSVIENAQSGRYECQYEEKDMTIYNTLIPADSTLGSLKKAEPFHEVGKYIMYAPGVLGMMTGNIKISEAEKNGWSSASIRYGLESLEKVTAKGTCMYRVYMDEECKDDKQKKDVNVIFMPKTADYGNKPFIVLCAGGAYTSVCSAVEGFPVAARFNDLGYDVFVLTYRVGMKDVMPKPLDDLASAVKMILQNKETYNVSEEYVLCGFSAGANLVCEFGTEHLGYAKYGLCKPKAIVPVYTFVNYNLCGESPVMKFCLKAMLGKEPSEEKIHEYNVDEHLEGYPPCFLVCGRNDSTVPAENSERMKEKLDELSIPCGLKIGANAEHGFGEGRGTDVEGWYIEADAFITSLL